MTKKLALIVGWAGGIYGMIRGIIMMTQPLYWRGSSSVPAPGQPPIETGPEPVPVDPVGAAFGILIISAIFIGILVLLTMGQREAFTGYALALFALSLLSLPSFGWVFLPATSLLILAAILLWLPPIRKEDSGRE